MAGLFILDDSLSADRFSQPEVAQSWILYSQLGYVGFVGVYVCSFLGAGVGGRTTQSEVGRGG